MFKQKFKYINVARNCKLVKHKQQITPKTVIREIFNAALNNLNSVVALQQHMINLLQHNHYDFNYIIDNHKPITL